MSAKTFLIVGLTTSLLATSVLGVGAVAKPSQTKETSVQSKEVELRRTLREGIQQKQTDAIAKVGSIHATQFSRRKTMYKTRFDNLTSRLDALMTQFQADLSASDLTTAHQKLDAAKQLFAQAETQSDTAITDLKSIPTDNFEKGKAKISTVGQKVSSTVTKYREAFNKLKEVTSELRRLDAKRSPKASLIPRRSTAPHMEDNNNKNK